jgi:predicted RNase H-like nuclease (RuvC/YqgF family)
MYVSEANAAAKQSAFNELSKLRPPIETQQALTDIEDEHTLVQEEVEELKHRLSIKMREQEKLKIQRDQARKEYAEKCQRNREATLQQKRTERKAMKRQLSDEQAVAAANRV